MKRTVRAGKLQLEYTLVRARRNDVRIQALEGGLTRVYAPRHARLSDVDALVRKHADRIIRMKEALKPPAIRDGDSLTLAGTPRVLRILQGAPRVEIAPDAVHVTTADPADEDQVRALLMPALQDFALRTIRARIDVFLPIIGGAPGKIAVRAQRTRWGSCSSKGNLSFNWKLILAPLACLDYVVVHELCHLAEFNHSPAFWKRVAHFMPDYTIWKEYLKRNGSGLAI
ncbi:MAG: M48 family metallopeptidase [Christensenellales bacterium]